MKNIKNSLKLASFLLVAVLFTFSCKSDPTPKSGEFTMEQFKSIEIIGVHSTLNDPSFAFDKTQHQMYQNSTQTKFYIKSNGDDELMTLECPTTNGFVGISKITCPAFTANLDLEVVQVDEDMTWLWDAEKKMGIIIGNVPSI